MHKKDITAMCPSDTAVEFSHVKKTFVRSQTALAGKEVIRRLFHPKREQIHALDDVTFTVKQGEFTAYAGPNGAGKSTTMKLACGILLPNSGQVRVLGCHPETERIRLMRQIGVLFGNRTELWWDHPLIQSFEWKKAVWNIPEAVYQKNLQTAVQLLDLQPLLSTFARELSLGQRMKADIAMLLLSSPKLLLLDEPTLGLDVTAKRQLMAFLKQENRQNGTTILVTSHDMDDLEEMTDRILMIANGKLVYDGTYDGLRTLGGHRQRLVVTSEREIPEGALPCRLVDRRQGEAEYELNTEETSFFALLQRLAALPAIRGVEIRKAPIEQVVDALYNQWQDTGTHEKTTD